MKESDSRYERLETRMRRAHVSEPSARLKERITAEASTVWLQTATDIPWQVPLRRLTAAAAAAILIVSLANTLVSRTQIPSAPVAVKSPTDLDTALDMPHGPFAGHLTVTGRRPPAMDASDWRDYREAFRQALRESDGTRMSPPLPHPGGSSHLIPGPSAADRHS